MKRGKQSMNESRIINGIGFIEWSICTMMSGEWACGQLRWQDIVFMVKVEVGIIMITLSGGSNAYFIS